MSFTFSLTQELPDPTLVGFQRFCPTMKLLSNKRVEKLKYGIYLVEGNPLMMVGTLLILALLLSAILAPFIAGHDPIEIHPVQRLKAPSFGHFFGTDHLGRDIYSRVIYGARISVRIGFVVILIALTLGTLVGLLSLYSSALDEIAMRLTDAFMSFPYLILAMITTMMLGPSLDNAILAMAIVWWPSYARLLRGQGLSVRKNTYIEASISLGASRSRVIFRHILPNSWVPILIQGTQDFGRVVIYAAGLSFIGLGAQPPIPEWGAMISEGHTYLRTAWWCSVFPGLGIMAACMGSNLLGDGLRDILDPKLKRG
jgi:peptide/nickel transport system permease protein